MHSRKAFSWLIDKGFDRILATRKLSALFSPTMRQPVASFILLLTIALQAFGQEATPASTPHRRGLLGRLLHPFSSAPAPVPNYKDPKLRGLVLNMATTPQTVKLSEIRQLEVKVTLTNQSKGTVTLDFPTNQRIEIYLLNAAEVVLTKWSDNHAITQKSGTVLINPEEHIEYNEAITTRDLTPNKVFIAEVFFPQYPELRIRQKFMTAP
jgi:hypothetical protein